jgi:HSP20 family molecular chaperone IbpA
MIRRLPYIRSNVGTDLFDGFDSFFRGFWDDEEVMKTDVKEEEKEFVLEIDLPGYEKENIGLSLENGYLIVSAKKTEEIKDEDKKSKYLRRERRFGSVSRSFFVGEGLKEEDFKASFKNGVLQIVFPKETPKKLEEKKIIAIE